MRKKVIRSIVLILIVTTITDIIYWIGNQVPIIQDIEKSILEVDLTDYYMSRSSRLQGFEQETSVELVNIESLKRDSIGLLLTQLAAFEPEVTFVDVIFREQKNFYRDSLLRAGLSNQKRLVLGTSSAYDEINDCWNTIPSTKYFSNIGESPPSHLFYQIFSSLSQGYEIIYDVDQESIVRYYQPNSKSNCNPQLHATNKAVELFGKKIPSDLNSTQLINFTGSISSGRFKCHSPEDIFNNKSNMDMSGKIIILGFFGDSNLPSDHHLNLESKIYTPLNPKLLRRTQPDMYSSEVTANIISMILNQRLINEISFLATYIINIAIVIISLLFMNTFWERNRKEIMIRIQSYGTVLILVIVTWVLFDIDVKIDFRIAILYLVLTPDIFKLYKMQIEKRIFKSRQQTI